jgi:gas vesicle protein
MERPTLITGAAIGAAAAYLLDPDRGRSRRARLHDRTAALARKAARRSRSWIRYRQGAARGVAHTLSKTIRERGRFVDDDTLLQKIRSEAIGPWDNPAREDVEVDVDRGIVTLKGRVATSVDRIELIELILKVDGVDTIRDRVEVGA